jgi:D-alanyl-D-alanine carboxypeptidase
MRTSIGFRAIITASFCLYNIICVESAFAQSGETTMRTTLDSLRLALGARGASAAVIFADGQAWTGASGESHPGRAITPTTLFELGSITKTYTAALILKLAAAGRLSLDDSVSRWVPEFADANGATLRQLLNHTSGIASVTEDPRYIPALIQNPAKHWGAAEQFEFVGKPKFAAGTAWAYSNTGYLLLGLVAERAGGSSVHVLFRRELLDPPALKRTFFEPADSIAGDKAHAFVDIDRDGTAEDLSAMIPRTTFLTSAWTAGAMTATAEDAARWIRALHEGPVLDAAVRAEMRTTVNRPDGNRHGLGLLVIGGGSTELLGHLGNAAGFSGAVFHAPGSGITIALLTNADAKPMREPARALLAAALRSR